MRTRFPGNVGRFRPPLAGGCRSRGQLPGDVRAGNPIGARSGRALSESDLQPYSSDHRFWLYVLNHNGIPGVCQYPSGENFCALKCCFY